MSNKKTTAPNGVVNTFYFQFKLKDINKTGLAIVYAETKRKAINQFKKRFNMENTEILEINQ